MMYTDKLIADMPVCFVYIYVHVNYLLPSQKSDSMMMVIFLD